MKVCVGEYANMPWIKNPSFVHIDSSISRALPRHLAILFSLRPVLKQQKAHRVLCEELTLSGRLGLTDNEPVPQSTDRVISWAKTRLQ